MANGSITTARSSDCTRTTASAARDSGFFTLGGTAEGEGSKGNEFQVVKWVRGRRRWCRGG